MNMLLVLLSVAAVSRPAVAELLAGAAAGEQPVATLSFSWKVALTPAKSAPAVNPWRAETRTVKLVGDLVVPEVLPPVPLSLETQLGQLEVLRTQKAVIEQQEAALVKAIGENAARQLDRMKKLGIAVPTADAGPPAKVSPKAKPKK